MHRVGLVTIREHRRQDEECRGKVPRQRRQPAHAADRTVQIEVVRWRSSVTRKGVGGEGGLGKGKLTRERNVLSSAAHSGRVPATTAIRQAKGRRRLRDAKFQVSRSSPKRRCGPDQRTNTRGGIDGKLQNCGVRLKYRQVSSKSGTAVSSCSAKSYLLWASGNNGCQVHDRRLKQHFSSIKKGKE